MSPETSLGNRCLLPEVHGTTVHVRVAVKVQLHAVEAAVHSQIPCNAGACLPRPVSGAED